ncbi:unnamed protein product [Anisakis simplex]|uniref:Uncharacterized protein n=1 Tax=Anisakis simplex TaxID=6269 RepID=A0A0M3K652_ANISI|nr:unnamed protein product [Anisakis simplex]
MVSSQQQNHPGDVWSNEERFGMNSEQWALYAVFVMLPQCVLIAVLFFLGFLVLMTPWGWKNVFTRFMGRPLLHGLPPIEGIGLMETLRGSGQPRLMSRFLSQDELESVYKLPLAPTRGLDLTDEDRKILNNASRVRCTRAGREDTFDYSGYLRMKDF